MALFSSPAFPSPVYGGFQPWQPEPTSPPEPSFEPWTPEPYQLPEQQYLPMPEPPVYEPPPMYTGDFDQNQVDPPEPLRPSPYTWDPALYQPAPQETGLAGEAFGTRTEGTLLEQLRQERLAEGNYGGENSDWAKLAGLYFGVPALGAAALSRVGLETIAQTAAAEAIPEIPGYERLPEPLQVAARNAPYFTPAGIAKATGMGGLASGLGLAGTVAGHYAAPELGAPEWAGEAVGGLAGAVAPTAGRLAYNAAEPAVRALTQEAVETSPQVLRLAVNPAALSDEGVEGLARSFGSKTIADPAGVRILAEGEDVLPGELEMFHGTGLPVEGGLKAGSFVTPDPQQAESYARSAAILDRKPAGKLRALTEQPELGAASVPGGGKAAGATVRSATSAQQGLPPPAAAAPTGGVPPSGDGGDVVKRLTDVIAQARKLPEETEAVRSAARKQRVAIGASQLERGGRTPEAYRAARGALSGEMPRASFDPPTQQFAPEEVQALREQLSKAELRFFEEINAEGALTKVLDGRLNEITPSEITLLDQVFGRELAQSIVNKSDSLKPQLWDYATEFRYFNMLSNPFTQARAFAGNLGATLLAPVERLGSAALEPAARRVAGRETERFFEEVPAAVFGGLRGIPEGVTGALDILRHGFNPAEVGKIEMRRQAFRGTLGRVIRGPSTLLEAADKFFYGINYRSALNADAVRAAKREGLRGDAYNARVADLIGNPSDELVEAAAKEAEMRLFRGDPGDFARGLMELRNKSPALQFLIPFLRTPANVLRFGIRRSPLGLLDPQSYRKVLAGNPEGTDEIARGLIGSTITASLAALVATGQLDITAAAPANPAERDRFFREGKLPFAMKVPGVGWVQYRQIDALNVPMTILASGLESFKNGEGITDLPGAMGTTIAANLADQSYMTGLADAMEAIQDPERNASWWAQRQVTSMVPGSAGLRQAAGIVDPTFRDPENLSESIQAGIPGLSQNVPPRLTAFGEEAQRGIPSPWQVSADKQNPVDTELERIGTEIGFVRDSIANIKLNREQQTLYQKAAGQLTYQMLSAVVETPAYKELPAENQVKVIDRIITASREQITDPFSDVMTVLDSSEFNKLDESRQQQVMDAFRSSLAPEIWALVEAR